MKLFYKLMATALLLVGMVHTTSAYEVKWNGSVSSDWADPANWTVVGDTIDAADGVAGYYIDSLDMWVKTWDDPSNAEVWYVANDSVEYALGRFDIYVPADAANTCMSDWNTPNNFNSSLSNGHWTRAGYLKVETGGELDWGFKNWHANYIDVHGTLNVNDTSYIRAAKNWAVGRELEDGDAYIYVNDFATMECKQVWYFGRSGENMVVEGEDTTYVPYNYAGHLILNDSCYVGGGQLLDLRGDDWNRSDITINGGTLSGTIRDLDKMTRKNVIIINAGEFKCYNDALNLSFAVMDSVIVSGNGAELIVAEVDENEDGTTDYVSITNANPSIPEKKETYEPYYDEYTNLVPDPTCSDVSLFAGWGLKSVVGDSASYAGPTAILLNDTIKGTGCSYPSGSAALDINEYTWIANTQYHLRAMVKTMNGPIGFLAKGSVDNGGGDIGFAFDTEGQWMQLDTIFTTGASPVKGFFSFNTCDFNSTATETYIDNYELYALVGTAVDDNMINESISIYPNPLEGNTFFISSDASSNLEVTIYNYVGQVVYAQQYAASSRVAVDANLNAGVYIIQVKSNSATTSQKLLVK